MERKLISAAAVREICGGVTDMTIWRWLHHPKLDFPKPIKIGRRNYWRETELSAWLDRQAEEARGAM
jgi:predicted DNA-binding transcriptional regulator AlpA